MAWIACVGLLVGGDAGAQVAKARAESQGAVPQPVVRADGDQGTAGEIPLDTPGVPDPLDRSALESPTGAGKGGTMDHVRSNTPLSVRLNAAVSSGSARNGDVLTGVLLQPVQTARGVVLVAGTPVKVTVLSVAKAGQISSAGALTLEVVEIGRLAVTSDVLEFDGQEGHRDVADSNPDKGTEAVIAAGAPLRFQVLGSGDKFELGAGGGASGAGSKPAALVSPGQGSVGAPGSTPTAAMHGAATPH